MVYTSTVYDMVLEGSKEVVTQYEFVFSINIQQFYLHFEN